MWKVRENEPELWGIPNVNFYWLCVFSCWEGVCKSCFEPSKHLYFRNRNVMSLQMSLQVVDRAEPSFSRTRNDQQFHHWNKGSVFLFFVFFYHFKSVRFFYSHCFLVVFQPWLFFMCLKHIKLSVSAVETTDSEWAGSLCLSQPPLPLRNSFL